MVNIQPSEFIEADYLKFDKANGQYYVKTQEGKQNFPYDDILDAHTRAVKTIEYEHHEIHEGHHYFINTYYAVSGAALLNVILENTGIHFVHYTFSISSDDAGFTVESYEAVTSNTDGTTLTAYNNNRNSTNTAQLVHRVNPTGISTVEALQIRSSSLGTAGGASQRLGGSVSRTNEVILKSNTKYLIRVTNKSSAVNNINLNMAWYENGEY